jgi:hypothetical protein
MPSQHLWPGDLPDRPTRNFTMTSPKLFDEFETDIGPSKRKRRTSSGVATIQTVWELSGEQVTSLESFYYTTTKGGSESFAGLHPRTGIWAGVMWMGSPTIGQPKGDDTWDVSFEIKVRVP